MFIYGCHVSYKFSLYQKIKFYFATLSCREPKKVVKEWVSTDGRNLFGP